MRTYTIYVVISANTSTFMHFTNTLPLTVWTTRWKV